MLCLSIPSTALYIASLAEVGSGRTLSRVEIAAVAWGVNVLSGLINCAGTVAIGRMSAFNVWWTLIGTIVLAVVLLAKAPSLVSLFRPQVYRPVELIPLLYYELKNTARFVFTDFEKFV